MSLEVPPISAGSTEGRPADGSPSTRVEFFDFRHRTRGEIPIADIPQQIEAGQFVWVDVDCSTGIPPSLGDVLPWRSVDGLDHCEVVARCAADKGHGVSSLNRTGDLLHIVLVGGAIRPDEIVDERLDVLLGTSFLLTVHRGANAVIQGVRSVYVRDFETHAATPSFLVYEIWSKQIEQLTSIITGFSRARACATRGDAKPSEPESLRTHPRHCRRKLVAGPHALRRPRSAGFQPVPSNLPP